METSSKNKIAKSYVQFDYLLANVWRSQFQDFRRQFCLDVVEVDVIVIAVQCDNERAFVSGQLLKLRSAFASRVQLLHLPTSIVMLKPVLDVLGV